jgi:hypothetical protein
VQSALLQGNDASWRVEEERKARRMEGRNIEG